MLYLSLLIQHHNNYKDTKIPYKCPLVKMLIPLSGHKSRNQNKSDTEDSLLMGRSGILEGFNRYAQAEELGAKESRTSTL